MENIWLSFENDFIEAAAQITNNFEFSDSRKA